MRLLVCCLLLLGVVAYAEERVKRQASYTFPGPRSDRAYRAYAEERGDEEEYAPAPRRQAAPQQQYAPEPAAYEPAPAPRQQAARAASSSGRRAAASSASRGANKYAAPPQQSLGPAAEEEEEDTGPDPLTLLLQDSQFSCGGKQDGYYADDSVGCQVFHYCVGGAKHSWMCPENTVFHQVHLNCVPDAQDICSQSQKFHFVNDYLYKPVDYDGPNNTARYSQRYYPDGYVVGDTLVAPSQEPRRPAPQQPAPRPPPQQAPPRAAHRPAPRPAPRPLESYPVENTPSYRQPAAVQPVNVREQPRAEQAYRAPAQQPQQAYRPAPQPAPREAQPAPQQVYRAPAQQAAPRPEQPQYSRAPQQAVRAEQPAHRGAPPQQVYRAAPAQQAYRGSPASRESYSSEENAYPAARSAYAPPRQQQHQAAYRQPAAVSARAVAAAYQQGYAPPQAGVQYDEEY